MKTTAYGPRTTTNLQIQWRALVAAANGKRNGRLAAATRFACSNGQRPGTGRWYAAALWHFNQH